MKNIKYEIVDDKLVITIDLLEPQTLSATGKTWLTATTGKPQKVVDDFYMALNLFSYKKHQ